MTNTRRFISVVLCHVALAACGSGGETGEAQLACVEELDEECEPTIPVSFDSLYTNIVQTRCGISGDGPSCHSAKTKEAGLDLSTAARAYDGLVGKQKDGKRRVLPGDPECSTLMERVEADDDTVRMPLDQERLPSGWRCAIQRWIAEGAKP